MVDHVDEIERRVADKVLVAGQVAGIDSVLEVQHMLNRIVAIDAFRQRHIDIDFVQAVRRRRRPPAGGRPVDAVGGPQEFAELLGR